jgi:hypothetical protein
MQRVLQRSWPNSTNVSINGAEVVAVYASGTQCIPNKAEPADTLHGAEEGRKGIYLCAIVSRPVVWGPSNLLSGGNVGLFGGV